MGEEDPEQVQVTSADSWRMGRIERVGTVKLVHVGGLLMMDGDSLQAPVWRSVGDEFTGRGESDVWLVRAGTWRPWNPWKQNRLTPIANIMQIAHGFFTSSQSLTSGFNFYSPFPHSFLLYLLLHPQLVFVWFSLPFSLLSPNFAAFSAHVAS